MALLRSRKSKRTALPVAIPPTGDVGHLVDAVAAQRRRPIRLHPTPTPPDAPSGLWIALEHSDVIVYPDDAPAVRRVAVICHELAHMLLGHQMHGADPAVAIAAIAAPDVDPRVAARFFARHGYDDEMESEAEDLGTRLAAALYRAAQFPDEHVGARLR